MFELTEQQQKSKDMWTRTFTGFRDYEHAMTEAEKGHYDCAGLRDYYIEHNTLTVIGHRQSLKIAAAEEMAFKDKGILFLGYITNPERKSESNFLDHCTIDFELLAESRDKGDFAQYDLIFITGVDEKSVQQYFTFFVDWKRRKPDLFHPMMKISVLLNKLAIN